MYLIIKVLNRLRDLRGFNKCIVTKETTLCNIHTTKKNKNGETREEETERK